MALTAASVVAKGLTTPNNTNGFERLIRLAEEGKVDWKILLSHEGELTKRLGEEKFEEYLNLALSSRGGGNFI